MFVVMLLLAAAPAGPVVAGAALPVDSQWDAVRACPRVSLPDGTAASGVVVGVRDGFGYLLTAAHAAPFDRVTVRFTSREAYPKPAWFADRAEVVARWPDPDIALVRFPVGDRAVPVLPLAPPGRRPKAFPVGVYTVGVGAAEAPTVRVNTIRAKEFVRREGKGPAFFWRTERPSDPGRSGGPLLDDRGRVIGLAAANRGGSGYHAHLDEVQAALKRDGFGWLVPPPGP